MKELLSIFTNLPVSTQTAIIGGIAFVAFLMREKLSYYIPAILQLVFVKKVNWKQVKTDAPEDRAQVVIKYLNRTFIRSKVIYHVSQSILYKEAEEVKKELLDVIEQHRGKGEMVVMVFASIETINDRIFVSLRFVFDKAIENNNIAMLIIFPKNLNGNMLDLYNYILDRNKMEEKSSISVKIDCRTPAKGQAVRDE